MSQTYRAIIQGNHINWVDDAPEADEALEVYVTLAKPPADRDTVERGQKMAAILEQLAQLNPFQEVVDPVAWQREQRQDRVLPQRDD